MFAMKLDGRAAPKLCTLSEPADALNIKKRIRKKKKQNSFSLRLPQNAGSSILDGNILFFNGYHTAESYFSN